MLFFVDDLCYKWIDMNRDNRLQPEEDLGYACFNRNGAYHYLEQEILSVNKDIKVTFFTCTGAKSLMENNPEMKVISHPMNHDEESGSFFRTIECKTPHEVAYHGTNHGIPGNTPEDYIQEWESFKSLEKALQTIEKGKKIYKEAIGCFPKGGKYCGYKSNEFSDDSIDQSGFKWWCRFDNRAAVDGHGDKYYCGDDAHPLTAYDVKFFGKNRVMDIPTTVYSNLLNPLFKKTKGFKGLIKRLLRPWLIRRKLDKEIGFLLKHQLVVSIQTHISPAREDGKRQALNIFDDRRSLRSILKYLKKKNVWYCTGSELADWISENGNQIG